MLSYTNPVFQEYFADPFVWFHKGEYYAIGTGPAEAEGHIPDKAGPSVFPLLRSSDLVNWETAGQALIRPDQSLGTNFWAPEIIFADGLWYLYYSVGFGDQQHQLRVATSNSPLGPYQDQAQLTSPGDISFAIDPHPFRDDDGRYYLFHARDFLDLEADATGPVRAGTALVVAELETMTKLSSKVHTVMRARCDWQLFAKNRSMYGQVFDWHTLEGPFVIKENGRYYCIYSGGCRHTDTYGVDYTVADHVLGPYEARTDLKAPRILKTEPGKVLGPGHCSLVRKADESMWVLAYHAWDKEMTARRLCIDPLKFGPSGPSLSGPSWTTQEI